MSAELKKYNPAEIKQHHERIQAVMAKIREIEKLNIKVDEKETIQGKNEQELEQMRAQLTTQINALNQLPSDEIADALISINALFELFELIEADLPKIKEQFESK